MGCNCKTVKNIDKRINANNNSYEKKGIKGLLHNLWSNIVKIINMLGTCLLIVLLVPVIIVILLYNFIFKNEAYVPLPSKFIHKNNEEIIEE